MKTHEHPFVIGEVYNRKRDIQAHFKGQERGGISTPTLAPLIFAYTSDSGTAFGYEDTFKPDGTFWYTGEGQVGDMQMLRGNAAILQHAQDDKKILLYEYTQGGKGEVRFLGEVEYLGHHIEQRTDRNGDLRNAIIFHLGFIPLFPFGKIQQPRKTYSTSSRLSSRLSLAELREIALESVAPDVSLEQKRANVARRAEAIKRYALARSKGCCEACGKEAPFKAKDGPFLEVHHVFRLADGGPDHPANVIALCPNCHRRAHYAIDAKKFNQELINWLTENETA